MPLSGGLRAGGLLDTRFFSAFLGVLGGFLGQLVLRKYADRQTRKTLLQLGYQYSGELLAVLDTLVSTPEPPRQHQHPALPIVLPAAPEDYTKAHREIYAALPEAASFDVIFNISKKLQEPSPNYDYVNAALQLIVLQFVKKRVTLKGVAKYRSNEEAASIKEILTQHKPAA